MDGRENRITDAISDTDTANPLSAIEREIRALMTSNGQLRLELAQNREKSESDIKNLLLDFIEVADAFERVFRNISPRIDGADQQTRIWINNFRTIHRSLSRALRSWDVTPVEAVIGEKANPDWHNVLETKEEPGRENGIILEELRKGYLWKGKLLRASEVKAVINM